MVCFSRVLHRSPLRDLDLPQDWSDDPDDAESFPIPDDTSYWDVFIPDDDELDPLPEPGDFWIEPEDEQGAESIERKVSELADDFPLFPDPCCSLSASH